MKNTIALLIVGLFVAGFSASSFAAVPEDCYKESKLPVADGEFLIFVDAANLSSAQVLTILQESNYSQGLLPNGFPTVSTPNLMMIALKLGTDQVSPPVSREELIPLANKSIQHLMTLPGVTVDCNHVFHHVGPIGLATM